MRRHRAAAVAVGGAGRKARDRRFRKSLLEQYLGESMTAGDRADACGRHHQDFASPGLGRVHAHRTPDRFMREAHHHVDRIARQIPGLDGRYRRGNELGAGVVRHHRTTQDDAIRAPTDDRQELTFGVFIVRSCQRQHHVVATLGERVGDLLDGAREDRVGYRGDHRGNQLGTRRRQASGQQIRHVTQIIHGRLHAQCRALRQPLRCVEEPRYRRCRHAGGFSHRINRHFGRPWRTFDVFARCRLLFHGFAACFWGRIIAAGGRQCKRLQWVLIDGRNQTDLCQRV